MNRKTRMTITPTIIQTRIYKLLRNSSMLVALLVILRCAVLPGRAQNYIFYNANYGYLINNSGNPGVSTTFTKSAIWIANNTMGTSNRNVRSYTDETKYFTGSAGTNTENGTFSLGTTNDNWQLRGTNYLNRRNANRGYVRYNGTGFIVNSSNEAQNFTGLAITINNNVAANPTISITAAAGLSNGGIQLTGNVTGTYRPAYSYATVRNYNNNNTQTYYWTATTDATTTNPTITDWTGAEYSWEVTTGGAYASVNSDGLVTITDNPTGNIVVTLTVTKGGYEGTQNYTLTRGTVAQSVNTENVITGPTLSPSSSALYYNEGSQVFTASASANRTTTTTPAYTTFTGSGNTYYYYNSALSASVPAPNVEETPIAVTLNWALSGDAASYLTRTPASGTSTTVTHSTQSPSDRTATLTVTATATGATTKTATATITAYGPMVAPTITRTGNTISIATANAGATIYYTTDGTTPTAESTEYTAPFDLTTSPTTIKAIAVRDGHRSTEASETYQIQLAAPTITVSNTGLATIAPDEFGATVYYTTDGTTPTSSSTPYSTGVQLANMQVIKAIAIKDGFVSSEVATADYVTTGISGTKLIIDDREDHTWTYYSDKPDPLYPDALRSPDPRNVKITYRGGSVDDASAVAVSATESVNEFVYYKTIEKYAWGGTENTPANTGRILTGEYAYLTIPNPFQKRPRTNGSTGTNGFWGFNGWKIISGGQYINGYNDEQTIPADTKINFVGLPAGNDGNGAIVLEAQWTEATVTVVNANITGNPNSAFSGGTFETNYVVVQGANRTVSGLTYNVTVTGTYPDGNAGPGGSLGNVTGSANNLKIENVNLGNGTAHTMSTGMYYIGRGCTGNVSTLYNNGSSNNIYMRVESGTYRYIHSMSKANTNNDNDSRGRVVFGCDYDRATNDGFIQNDRESNHTKRHLRVVNYVSVSADAYHHANNDRSEHMDITVKSGFFGFSADVSDDDGGYGIGIGGNTDQAASSYTANYYNHSTGLVTSQTYNLNGSAAGTGYWQQLMSFYTGTTRSGDKGGVNRVLIEGGEFNSINGGGYRPTYANANDTVVSYHFRMKGGWVKGAIYGTASASYTNATTKQVITGGEINGWIAGACNGTDVSSENNSGWNRGNTYIYFGGTAELRSHQNDGNYNNTWGLVGGVEGGNIFASGRGCEPGNTNYNYCGSSNHTYTVVADKSKVEQSVFGGGYIGVAKRSHIFITGGEIGKNVYGGASSPLTTSTEWRTSNTDIRMYGGTVKGGIYGGHYLGANDAGKIHGDVHVSIYGGQVGADDSHRANIHGGGFGSGTTVSGNVSVILGKCDAESGATIYGDVYGGSALGSVNTNANNTTIVDLYKGTIYGGLYGGALGDVASLGAGHSNVAAAVNGAVTVNVLGGSVLCTIGDPDGEAGTGSVFGCNNVNGTPASTVNVHIYNTDQPLSGYALHAVYGGGNKAAYNGTPEVTIHGCSNSIEYVYGGGNATDVRGTDVTIWGGQIGNAFAGGNGFSETGNHTQSNQPHYNPGANITTSGTHLTIHGGTIGAAFGGSNQYGTITGGVNVTVSDDSEAGSDPCGNPFTSCPMDIAELYGGGNEAPLISSRNPNVFIGKNDIHVSLDCSAKVGMLFGGAKAADYEGDIDLVVDGGTFNKVFGGNNMGGTITGNVSVTFNGGSANEVYGGCNQSGTIMGTVIVTIDSTNATCDPPFYVGDVYGGGNLAGYSHPAGQYPEVNVINGCVRGNVYGGGFGSTATVTGSPKVTIGDNNPNHKVTVGGDVYGGGNAAPVTNNTEVLVTGKTKVFGNIYGGGNQGEVNGNTKVIINSK